MLDVMTRLAQLDAGNPNVVEASKPDFLDMDKDGNKKEPMKKALKDKEKQTDESAECSVCNEDPCKCDDKTDEEMTLESMRYLAGVKNTIAECGIPPMGMPGGQPQPATFSINASAQTGDEVAGMINQIMNLAGVHKPVPSVPHAEPVTALTAEPEAPHASMVPPMAHNDGGKDMMRSMLDKMNTADEGEEISMGSDSPVAAMADEVRDMAGQLSGTSKDELGLESWDNTPASPTDVPLADSNGLAFQPNAGGHNKGVTNQPTAFAENLEDRLFAEYQNFVNEGKKAKKDYDGDGKVESGKDEYFGSKDKAIKKAQAKK